jgi:hypothetical protein
MKIMTHAATDQTVKDRGEGDGGVPPPVQNVEAKYNNYARKRSFLVMIIIYRYIEERTKCVVFFLSPKHLN